MRLQQEKDVAIQNLVLGELIDVLMPIVYVCLLMMAYYGPNAAILGTVGCEKWMWKKINHHLYFLSPKGAILKSREDAIKYISINGNSQDDLDMISSFKQWDVSNTFKLS